MSELFTKNLLIRALSGAVLVAIVAAGVLLSPWTKALLMCVICVGSMGEFYRLAILTGASPQKIYPIGLGVAAIAIFYLTHMGIIAPEIRYAIIPATFVIPIAELYRKKDNPFGNIAWSLTGLLYIAVPMTQLALMDSLTVMAIFVIVWANDIGAYIFGVSFGRHRLFERISPKKSWEGFFGGVLCAAAMGIAVSGWLEGGLWLWIGAAVIISLAAVAGDLVESMLKRSAQVKDAGNIIPGHGGFLDRFDAILLASPFVFTYFRIYFAL